MTWTPSNWQRFAASRLGTFVTDPPCGTTRSVAVSGGSVSLVTTVESGPEGTPTGPPCDGARGETMTWAVALLDDSVVTVNLPICFACFSRGATDDPYGTPDGIEAVVRGLRSRP